MQYPDALTKCGVMFTVVDEFDIGRKRLWGVDSPIKVLAYAGESLVCIAILVPYNSDLQNNFKQII